MRAVTFSRMVRPPRALSDEYLLYLMAENDWTVEEIAKEVDGVCSVFRLVDNLFVLMYTFVVQITPQELLDFRNDLVSHARILVFAHGNAPDDVCSLWIVTFAVTLSDLLSNTQEINKVVEVVETGFVSADQTFTDLESKSLLLPPGTSFPLFRVAIAEPNLPQDVTLCASRTSSNLTSDNQP